MQKSQDELKAERVLRNAKYANEDLDESIWKANLPAFTAIGFGLLWLIATFVQYSVVAPLYIVSIFVGIMTAAAMQNADMRQKSTVLIIAGVFLTFTFIEFLTFGLPNRLIPNLGEFGSSKIIGLVTILNDFSPILYYAVPATLCFTFIKVVNQIGKWTEIPSDIRNKILRE